MLRHFTVAIVSLGLALSLANLSVFANGGQVVIYDAIPSGATLAINGMNFGTAEPTVIIDGTIILPVSSSSPTQISVTLPTFPSGTYLLTFISNGDGGATSKKKGKSKKGGKLSPKSVGSIDVTLGAAAVPARRGRGPPAVRGSRGCRGH